MSFTIKFILIKQELEGKLSEGTDKFRKMATIVAKLVYFHL